MTSVSLQGQRISAPLMSITQEQLEAILLEFADDNRLVPCREPLIENSSVCDTSPMLPLRLLRAAVDQSGSDAATASRYRIWAETLRETIAFAVQNLDEGATEEEIRTSLVRAVNSLGAYCSMQAILSPFGAT